MEIICKGKQPLPFLSIENLLSFSYHKTKLLVHTIEAPPSLKIEGKVLPPTKELNTRPYLQHFALNKRATSTDDTLSSMLYVVVEKQRSGTSFWTMLPLPNSRGGFLKRPLGWSTTILQEPCTRRA